MPKEVARPGSCHVDASGSGGGLVVTCPGISGVPERPVRSRCRVGGAGHAGQVRGGMSRAGARGCTGPSYFVRGDHLTMSGHYMSGLLDG